MPSAALSTVFQKTLKRKKCEETNPTSATEAPFLNLDFWNTHTNMHSLSRTHARQKRELGSKNNRCTIDNRDRARHQLKRHFEITSAWRMFLGCFWKKSYLKKKIKHFLLFYFHFLLFFPLLILPLLLLLFYYYERIEGESHFPKGLEPLFLFWELKRFPVDFPWGRC